MNPSEYVKNVLKTESNDFEAILGRLTAAGKPVALESGDGNALRLLHAAIGINTEAGEVIDLVKKQAFYGKQVDRLKFIDELGDLMWYTALALDSLGGSFEEVFERNIAKLKARYGEKFSESAALNRDAAREDAALKGAQ